ncbi:hypothetical protein HMPREF9134_01831 [Porphyromonas catoniae F0037]|uniref:Uncharacterized protein n=1 Tax=Porphyromonas catoniae F0037 TaxID=1127696 RepID=L1N964_9PORP|nr:hypothetical protein HMPREF9134_01831 [Porphyromonas catoniae F0037]
MVTHYPLSQSPLFRAFVDGISFFPRASSPKVNSLKLMAQSKQGNEIH